MKEYDSEGTVLLLDEPSPEKLERFFDVLRASGLWDAMCERCYRPWLTREPDRFCPECRLGRLDDPAALDRARATYEAFWRRRLLETLSLAGPWP